MICGICLDKINNKQLLTCEQCNNPVHEECWKKWVIRCGRCIYCNYEIIKKKNEILSSSDEEERIIDFLEMGFSESDDDDDDWEPIYNTRIRRRHIFLRPRNS